jgi:hypothetical protein
MWADFFVGPAMEIPYFEADCTKVPVEQTKVPENCPPNCPTTLIAFS